MFPNVTRRLSKPQANVGQTGMQRRSECFFHIRVPYLLRVHGGAALRPFCAGWHVLDSWERLQPTPATPVWVKQVQEARGWLAELTLALSR